MHVGEAKRMGREENYYSMMHTSKPLEGHGHHVEYCGGIYWYGEGQKCNQNKRSLICFRVRLTFIFRANKLSTFWGKLQMNYVKCPATKCLVEMVRVEQKIRANVLEMPEMKKCSKTTRTWEFILPLTNQPSNPQTP